MSLKLEAITLLASGVSFRVYDAVISESENVPPKDPVGVMGPNMVWMYW